MVSSRKLLFVALVALLVVAPLPVQAQTSPGVVTLHASKDVITFGDDVRMSGKVDPSVEGQQVDILDSEGNVRGSDTTDNAGRYSLRIKPRANDSYRAQSNGVISNEVSVRVKPLLQVNLADVQIFGTARAWGHIQPGQSQGVVVMRLKKFGHTVAARRVHLHGAWFKTRFPIKSPGNYRVVGSFDDDDHLAVADSSEARETITPRLSDGSRSIYVKRLEQRLKSLGYHLDGVNKRFTYKTSDALIAFNKVQGRARVGYVDEGTWRALADPIIPKPRYSTPKYHIEVDQTKQVLYVVRKNKVIHILHVSTGAGGATHDGVFDFDRKLAGYSGHRLYYPSYFDGARAVHGWPEVPTYNASHGCVRVPMWTATWIYGLIDIGNIIKIYH